MSRLIIRPNQAVDYGSVQTNGAGNVLGDDSDGTSKSYFTDSGSILLYPTFNNSMIPTGRSIIAVRAGFRQAQGGFLGFNNGWVKGFLRINGAREPKTETYKQDGFNTSFRSIESEPLYKSGLVPWTVADMNSMTTDIGTAQGEIGPDKGKRWTIASEGFIVAIFNDDVPVPSTPHPADNSTINTSSVSFNAVIPATQPEQPVGAIFQVARDAAFTQTVKTFIGGVTQETAPGSKSYYVSSTTDETYTGLAPGKWYMRMKGRDYLGTQSAWGATTSFNIVHDALPAATHKSPSQGVTRNTPYGTRTATIATAPTGGRRVGMGWQFSQSSDFASSPTVEWTNNTDGAIFGIGDVSYVADPDATIAPALRGGKVSVGDPDQYLKQGTWYARVRLVDVYGQVGPWSASVSFLVSHPPTVASVAPSGGKAFDDDVFPVSWKFADPWSVDSQTAYRIVISQPNNTVIHDTGKVASLQPQGSVTIPDTFLQQNLNLSLTVWDRDDVASTTPMTATFRLSKAPVVSVSSPTADQVLITGQPMITWSSVFATGSITQKSFRLDFIRRDNGKVEYSSGTINGTATSWSAPTAILKNISAYQLALTITDSDDLYTTFLRNFSTNYVIPPQLSVYAYDSTFEKDGYVTLTWADATVDPLFYAYRIYKQPEDKPNDPWTLVTEIGDPSVKMFHDWTTTGQKRWRYTLTQVILNYGAFVESKKDPYGPTVMALCPDYFIIDPDDETNNVRLYHVTGDKFTDKDELNEIYIIGRGRAVRKGGRVGIEGSLSAQVRTNDFMTAEDQIDMLHELKRNTGVVQMRTPFGKFLQISIGDISETRVAGVGYHEYLDIEIPYLEVSE